MNPRTGAEFGIGVLSDRTGIKSQVLRAWERRFGLEIGTRTASGHRRFTEEDVALVREIVDSRRRGLTLAVAIAGAVDRRRSTGTLSVHASLANHHPELRRMRLDHRHLVALSTVMEDELLARGERTTIWGGFQDGRAYSRSRRRWEELCRTSTWCAVLADFSERPPESGDGPVLINLPRDSPMLREWCVVALSSSFAVILSAWEVPTRTDERTYETFVSTRRPVVITAARALAEITQRVGVPTPPQVMEMVNDADPIETSIRDVDRLWARVIEALVGRDPGLVR